MIRQLYLVLIFLALFYFARGAPVVCAYIDGFEPNPSECSCEAPSSSRRLAGSAVTCNAANGLICDATHSSGPRCLFEKCEDTSGEKQNFHDCNCKNDNSEVKCTKSTGLVCDNLPSTPRCGCPSGRYLHTTNQVCESCPSGQFSETFTTGSCNSSGCAIGKYASFESCLLCPKGFYQNQTAQIQCLLCSSGKVPNAVATGCVTGCSPGTYLNNGNCTLCSAGQYLNNVSLDNSECESCPRGKFLSDESEVATLASTSRHDDIDDCFDCPDKTFSDEGAQFCRQCPSGYYQKTIDKKTNHYACDPCAPGKFVKEPGKYKCTDCPLGFFMSEIGSSFCLPCFAGFFADQVKSSSCKNCEKGKFRTHDILCKNCPLGFHNQFYNSSACFPCSPGTYSEEEGQILCKECEERTYADEIKRKRACSLCPIGWESDQSKASCSRCSIGKYGSELGLCENCKLGQYQDEVSKKKCKEPQNGKVSNEAKTAQERPLWKIPSDCSSKHYLNDLSNNTDDWKCEECPNGGDCNGDVVWQNIKPLNGFWRISSRTKIEPPLCYYSKEESCPIFVQCLYLPACLGSPNVVNASTLEDSKAEKLMLRNNNESCNEKYGFLNSSRLCQTCGPGWSRSWGSTCLPCTSNNKLNNTGNNSSSSQDLSEVIILFSGGFTLAITFYITLVALRKKAFQRDATSAKRKKSVHSTIKRILLSHMQMLNTIIHLTVPWPSIIMYMLDGMSSLSGSFGDSTNALECLYENQSHSEFYLWMLIVVALFPFLFVFVLSLYWCCVATRSDCLGCGKKVQQYGNSLSDHNKEKETESQMAFSTEQTAKQIACKRPSSQHRNFVVSSMDGLIMSSILFWFMILPSILRMSFVSLECHFIPNEEGKYIPYLLIDLEQQCWQGKHIVMTLIAIPLVLFHVVIIPCIIFFILHKAGKVRRETDPTIMFRLGLLHSGYRSEKYWWEFVVLVRKVMLVSISTFASTDQLQLHFSLAILIVSLHLHDTNRPFGFGEDQGKDLLQESLEDMQQRHFSEKALHRYEMGSLLWYVHICF
jgi:hypothetical protein